ncbi:MAG: glycosyltransferase [Bacteroidota bacterium]
MKILHINTYDFGGAATACRRIHLGLLEKGVDSKMLLLHKSKNIPQSFKFYTNQPAYKPPVKLNLIKRVLNKIGRIVVPPPPPPIPKEKRIKDFSKIDPRAEYFTFPYSPYDITLCPLYQEADIIQINWASGFLNEESFFTKNTKPVIWRMPDLYPCGGGNHYEKGFPFESFKEEIDFNLALRKKSLSGKNIVFVPISNWVKQKAEDSNVIGEFPKKMIHNGVDFNVFKPHNRGFARQVFNLPENKIILLFGSDTLTNKRKGFEILLEALKGIDQDKIQLVAFGQLTSTQNFNCISVGEVKDELLLSILYASADYFVMPSVEEAFGQVTIEALASGTPVISFPNGGSVDIIKNGLNGFLAKGFAANDLKDAINEGLNTNFNKDKLLEDVHQRFNIVDKVDEYINLYKSALQ